jgi:hypothetical protein
MEVIMGSSQKYQFDWENTVRVNMGLARPNPGPYTRIEVYQQPCLPL